MIPPSSLSPVQRDLLAGEYRNMLQCVRCGACLTSCPTYILTAHEAEGPRGRVAMIRSLFEGEIGLSEDLVRHEGSCLVCDACTSVCPAGVNMEPLQVAFRAALTEQAGRKTGGPLDRLVKQVVFRNMSVFRALAHSMRFYQRSGLQWLARHSGVLKLMGLRDTERLLPPVARDFVKPRGQRFPSSASAGETAAPEVALFAGCVMSTALADCDHATVRVLQRAGCDVTLPAGQGCCGALNAHGGDLDGARGLARETIAAFEPGERAPVLVNSAGCGAMLKTYPHILAGDPEWSERAERFAERVGDITEYLASRDLPLREVPEIVVTYQDACHLANAQGIRQQPRKLLRSIPGLKLVEMAETSLCCGSAGVYNVTNPGTSGQLRSRKVDAVLATGASVVVTGNPGCLMQLRSGLEAAGAGHVRVKHIVELLDEASRL